MRDSAGETVLAQPGAKKGPHVGTQLPKTGDGASDTTPPTLVDVSGERGDGKSVVKERFVLEKLLGAGGMGSVYKAKDLRKVEARDRNPWVAVKLLNDDFKTHPDAFISLQREARKSQALAHPNIVKVYDFDRDGDMVFMTMELLGGSDLNHYIRDNPDGVEMDEVLRLTREMGAALRHAHANNIIHADFKPANVFLTEDGTAKVLDFGIAQAVAQADVGQSAGDKTVFDPGSLGALTPAYASLEMLQGKDPLPADDIFALGCAVYQLVSGRHPYDKMPADQAARQGKEAPKLEKLNRKQWRALQRAVALKREDRYETVAEFLKEFAPYHNPWARRLGIAVGVALMLGAVGVYQAVMDYYEEEAREAEVRKQRAELTEASEQMQAERSLKKQLDDKFSEFRSTVDVQEAALDQHRFRFEPTLAWQQHMDQLLIDLERLHDRDDWSVLLSQNGDVEQDARDRLAEAEVARRNVARQGTTTWLQRYREKVSEDYLAAAASMARERDFTEAQASIYAAERLYPDSPKLQGARESLQSLVAAAQAEAERVLAEAQAARLESDFAAADAAFRRDLESCTQTLSRTGRGGQFTYDIRGMAAKTTRFEKTYAPLGNRARVAVQGYVAELGACIQMYGYADPAGARERLEIAKQSLPNYADSLGGLVIQPWNNCKPSFAGKGQRYDCFDRFLGAEGRGPALVVVPAAAGMPGFSIGKYEVSIGEFNTWCNASGACAPSAEDGALPVTGRSAEEVMGYLEWLSESTGFQYQLPSHRQWVYAADAQGTGLDPGRNCTLTARGIVKGQVFLPIESGASNQWGLVHHLGNAREMVTVSGGIGAAGGSRVDPIDDCTVEALDDLDQGGDSVTGFRVVRLSQ